MYYSTKTYGHEVGLSACFRQWRADSHCNKLHGYALAFKIVFKAATLDDRNWVMDFGGLKKLKEWLVTHFDHKTVIAKDDPEFEILMSLSEKGICDIVVLDSVGCEAFARYVFLAASLMFNDSRIQVHSVECREHGANSAIYQG